MEKLETFLESLSDHELAKFAGYRYDDFLGNSREKIIRETQKRNFDKAQLVELFNTPFDKQSEKETCPQCGSDKLFIETDYDVRAKRYYRTVEVAIDTKRCQICNYNPLKRKPKNLIDRIRITFKKKGNERIKRITKWNFWN